IAGQGRNCERVSGQFTVDELNRVYEDVRSFAITFEQHCNGNSAALRGTWRYRAGDTTPPAPWMTEGSGATDPVARPGGRPQAAPPPPPPPGATPAASPAPAGGPAAPASATIVSEPGDYVGGGAVYSFDAGRDDTDIEASYHDGGVLSVSVYGG